MKTFIIAILLSYPCILLGDQNVYQNQELMLKQQQSYAIEDIIYQIEYLKKRISDNKANKYEKYKLEKLEERLKTIQDNNGLNY